MSSAISDPYLRVALAVGFVAVALTAALTLAIVVLRLRLRARERRWQRFVATWRPALLGRILDPASAGPLPPLPAREHVLFLRLWAYLQESVRGEARQQLNETARALGLDATARRLLRRGARAEKLQATLAAGYLRDAEAWDALVDLARSADPLLAVNAARALVQINPLRAANGLMPLLVVRTDWDLSRIAGFLADARHAFWLLMAKSIPLLRPHELPRTLLLAEALRLQLPDATVSRLLQPGQPAEVVQAALRLTESLALADEVRRCLGHADAGVREQAAVQMAQLARREDVPALSALLGDPQWRVRMAAARALARLPFLAGADLQALAAEYPAAAAQVRQVLAERGLG